MKLHWSPRSPYVRKVMILAHEIGVADQIDCVRTVVSMFKPADELFADNPLNKLPTLVLNDGTSLFDSRVICEYLDATHDGPKLFPSAGQERLFALRNQALGDGLLDVLMMRLTEKLKPEDKRTDAIVQSNKRKSAAAVDRLEADVALLSDRDFDIGHIAVGTALGYLDFRFNEDSWRDGHPNLAAWHLEFSERASVLAVQFEDDR